MFGSHPDSVSRLRAGALGLLGALSLAACGGVAGHGGSASFGFAPPADHEVVYSTVEPFRFVERSGREITEEDLAGRTWILGLFFSRCAGPCPQLIGNMAKLQDELGGEEVQLVALSVDPAYDTPERLSEYAEQFNADPERWWFLVGEQEATDRWIVNSLQQATVRKPPEEEREAALAITHSTRLMVIDGKGQVRGGYDGESKAGLEAARARALAVRTEGGSAQ